MAYTIVDKNPAVREIVVDTAEDIAEINVDKFLPGTTVFVIEDKTTYMLKHDGEWADISSDESEEEEEDNGTPTV